MKSGHRINFKNKKALIIALTLIFISPSWAVTANGFSNVDQIIKTNADLESLEEMNVFPNLDLSSGWTIDENSNSEKIELRFRNAQPISPTQWSLEFGDLVSGWYILQHSMPVPSEWLYSLNDAGIECHSYIPHGAFHCFIPMKTTQELEQLEVQGIMSLDPTDKVHPMIDELLVGEFKEGYTIFGKGVVTIFL